MARQEDTKHLSEVELAQQGSCACKILIDGVNIINMQSLFDIVTTTSQ